MKIHCLKVGRPNKGKYNYVIVYNWAAWPARSLVARGWHKATTVYVRAATEDEVQEWRHARRCIAYRYETWNQILQDESAYGVDANHLRTVFGRMNR